MRHRAWPLITAALLGALGPAAAEPPADPVLQEALVRLDSHLADADPVFATRLLDEVAQRTGRTAGQLRAHLTARVDDLVQHADGDTAVLHPLTDLGAPELSPRQSRRYLRQLLTRARTILDSDAEYLLGPAIRQVARQARVPAEDAARYTARLVRHGIVDTATSWAPQPRLVVVRGWTEPFELAAGPLLTFHAIDDEPAAREAVRDLQRFLVPRLVRRLPASRAVRFAVRERELTPLVDPDLAVRITVQALRFAGTNADLLPCLEARLDIGAGNADRDAPPAWTTQLSHCTATHGSSATHELAPFFDEVADSLFQRVDAYLDERR